MTLFEAFLYLFFDSFIHHLLIPDHNEAVFIAMRIFGGYNMTLASIVASFAGLIAILANFYLGKFINICSKFNPENDKDSLLSTIVYFIRKHGYTSLLLVWIPFIGPICVIALGFSNVKIKYVGVIGFISFLTYYFLRGFVISEPIFIWHSLIL